MIVFWQITTSLEILKEVGRVLADPRIKERFKPKRQTCEGPKEVNQEARAAVKE
jgi:hypothetical protein